MKTTSTSRRTTLYALGSNGSSQLGLGHNVDVSSPQKCRFSSTSANEVVDHVPLNDSGYIKKIVAGGNHTLLLTTEGRIWATGSNKFGQCGSAEIRLGEVAAATWRKVKWLSENNSRNEESRCTDVAAAWTTSYLVVDGHIVYSCGHGDKGELGISPDRSNALQPTLCFDLWDSETDMGKTRIEHISACVSHVVVLSSAGNLYGWGACRKGQLGEELRTKKIVWLPERLHLGLTWAPKQIVTGRDFTFVVGERPEEQCFLGDTARLDFDMPMRTKPDWQLDFRIYAGWTHVVIWSRSDGLHGLGRNTRGQLLEKQLQREIEAFNMGSEHSIAKRADGHVIAWGWGEHGNCGSEVDEQRDVKSRCNILFLPTDGEKVVGVAAGCATTFFWVEEAA